MSRIYIYIYMYIYIYICIYVYTHVHTRRHKHIHESIHLYVKPYSLSFHFVICACFVLCLFDQLIDSNLIKKIKHPDIKRSRLDKQIHETIGFMLRFCRFNPKKKQFNISNRWLNRQPIPNWGQIFQSEIPHLSQPWAFFMA